MGAAFVIYGLYLLLFFSSGHVFIFFYAFILPIMMACGSSASARRTARAATSGAGVPVGDEV